jgi:hypothetical protein
MRPTQTHREAATSLRFENDWYKISAGPKVVPSVDFIKLPVWTGKCIFYLTHNSVNNK